MAQQRVQRRLAAILAADVAGYSRLMGEDEEGTLAALTAHHTELIEPCITEHRGRVVKTTGDGLLAEFASVVDAVRCAVAFQEGMRDRNTETSKDRRIDFRIGVNLGDVIVQDDDVYGDGVNVAARLEGLAKPGGIVVSGMVHEVVRPKLDFGFDDLGPQAVKNIAEPVRAFSIHTEVIAPSLEGLKERTPLPLPDRPSIAVLPFENMSSDPEQEYFSDGITEDIITDLSKIPDLMVIARNSTFAYKGRHVSLREIGRDLGVRYVLEGSVRKAGERVRITAQLIDATNESHVWAERYDGALDNIFSLQDLVTGEIVAALKPQLRAPNRMVATNRNELSVEAYDHVLRARQYFFRFTREANSAARAEIEKAIAIDPEYAEGVALMAECHLQIFNQVWSNDPTSELQSAADHARWAVELDDQLPEGHAALANVHLWQRLNDKAVEEIDRAIEISPNNARFLGLRAMIRAWSGYPEDAIADAKDAIRLDPNSGALLLWSLGMAQYHAGRYDDAETNLRESALLNPDFMPVQLWLAANQAHKDNAAEAKRAIAALRRINPAMTIRLASEYVPFRDATMLASLADDLRKAGMPE